MAPRSRVLVVDDHQIVRQGLAHLIDQEADLAVCGEAEDLPSAMRLVSELEPDVIIVDLSLKGASGIDLIKEVHRRQSAIPLLVLSMHEEAFHVERALRAGASGYLTKQEASEKILIALRRVLAGEIYVSDRVSVEMLRRALAQGQGDEGDAVDRLSDRELQVFQLIGEGKGPREIARTLDLSVKTIEAHQEHIRAKLGVKDSRQLLLYAMRWIVSRGGSQA